MGRFESISENDTNALSHFNEEAKFKGTCDHSIVSLDIRFKFFNQRLVLQSLLSLKLDTRRVPIQALSRVSDKPNLQTKHQARGCE